MEEPILTKAPPHGYDNRPLSKRAFKQLVRVAQRTADRFGYPIYLVGSVTYKEVPRDIDISVIMPESDFIEMFGDNVEEWGMGVYLGYVFHKSFEHIKDLHFVLTDRYHTDIKVCPDTWWVDKPKMLLAEPRELEK